MAGDMPNHEQKDEKRWSDPFPLYLLSCALVFLTLLLVPSPLGLTFQLIGAIFGTCVLAGLSLVWFVVVDFLYRKRGWRRFRTHWLLLPSVMVILTMLIGLVLDQRPKNPDRYFKSYAGTELPANATQLRWEHTRGAFESGVQFAFTTTPDDVDRLVAEMDLRDDGKPDAHSMNRLWLRDFADYPLGWQEGRIYRGRHGSYWLTLITNAAKTGVYFFSGDT